MRIVRAVILLIAVAIGAAFASMNFGSTTVDVLFTTIDAPLVLFIGGAFAIGLLIGLLASSMRILRLREQLRRSRHQGETLSPAASKPPAPKLR